MRPLLCHLSYAAASEREQKIYRLAERASSNRLAENSESGGEFENAAHGAADTRPSMPPGRASRRVLVVEDHLEIRRTSRTRLPP
jgi:hypothetical protein